MRKGKADVEGELGDPHFFSGDDDADELGIGRQPSEPRPDAEQALPARQLLELRNEQRHLREQLSDWDDYGEDFDT